MNQENNDLFSIGVLYVATGKKYIKAAIRSAKSVRAVCPTLPVHIFASWQDLNEVFSPSSIPFTTIGNIENPHRRSKIDYLSKTPFDRTLYLDTDTSLNVDITGIFQLLDRFDVALGHAHRRNELVRTRPWRVTLPEAFPQFNSGVFLYKTNPEVLQLLESWSVAFREAGFPQDQVTLRELLWLSDLRIATLPPEYNVRFMKYKYLWTKSEATPKIYHLRKYHEGRIGFLKRLAKRMLRGIIHKKKKEIPRFDD